MPIQLPPRAEAVIRENVTSGLCANPEQAIDAAVRLLDEHDRGLERLRALIAEDQEGEGVPWTPEIRKQLSREANEMYWRGEDFNPDVCPEGDYCPQSGRQTRHSLHPRLYPQTVGTRRADRP